MLHKVNSPQVVLHSVSLEAMQCIALCGSNETYQRGTILLTGGRDHGNNQLSWLLQILNVNIRKSRRSLVWFVINSIESSL